MEACINQLWLNPGNFGKNVIDFEEILRAPNILPAMGCSDDCSGNAVGTSTVDSTMASGFGLTHITGSAYVTDIQTSTLGVVQYMQADMLPTSQELLRLSNEDISAHVPVSLQQNIAKDEFKNLALLIKSALELSEIVNSSVIKMSSQGTLEAKPKECKDKIPSIEKWTDAMLIFVLIYVDPYQN